MLQLVKSDNFFRILERAHAESRSTAIAVGRARLQLLAYNALGKGISQVHIVTVISEIQPFKI